jgi:hypothetical protein
MKTLTLLISTLIFLSCKSNNNPNPVDTGSNDANSVLKPQLFKAIYCKSAQPEGIYQNDLQNYTPKIENNLIAVLSNVNRETEQINFIDFSPVPKREYILFKYPSGKNLFKKIASSNMNVFKDEEPNLDYNIYEYKIITKDENGNYSKPTNSFQNICLKLNGDNLIANEGVTSSQYTIPPKPKQYLQKYKS